MMTHPLHFYGPISDPIGLLKALNGIYRDTPKHFHLQCVVLNPFACPEQANRPRHPDGWPIHVQFVKGTDAGYGGECPSGSIVHVGKDEVPNLLAIKLAHEIGHCFALGHIDVYPAAGQVDPTPGVRTDCRASATQPCGFWRRNRHWRDTVMMGNSHRWCEYERRIMQAQCQRGDLATVPDPLKSFQVAVYDRRKEPIDGARVHVYRRVMYRQKHDLQLETETGKNGTVNLTWSCGVDDLPNDPMRVIVVTDHRGRVAKDWVHAMEQVEAEWLGRKHQVEVTM